MFTASRVKYLVCDLIATLGGWIGFYVYRFGVTGRFYVPTLQDYLSIPQVEMNLCVIPSVLVCIYALEGFYAAPAYRSHTDELEATFWSVFLATWVIFFGIVIDDVPLDILDLDDLPIAMRVSPRVYWELFGTLFLCLFLPLFIVRGWLTHLQHKKIGQGMGGERVLWIGKEDEVSNALMGRHFKPLYVVGHIAATASVNEVAACAKQCHAERLIMEASSDIFALNAKVFSLFSTGFPISTCATDSEIDIGMLSNSTVTSVPLVDYDTAWPAPVYRYFKRAADIAVASGVLVLCAPLFVLLAVWVKCDSKGTAFFSQERIGRAGKPFRIYKFRTMRMDAEVHGPCLSSANDTRITSLGRYLRRYRIDELPQFWNVLKGDMSLVGPRPERRYYIEQLLQQSPYYARLFRLRPGITSWGVVKYGYASSLSEMIARARYDQLYISQCSLNTDLKVLGQTTRIVCTGKGV